MTISNKLKLYKTKILSAAALCSSTELLTMDVMSALSLEQWYFNVPAHIVKKHENLSHPTLLQEIRQWGGRWAHNPEQIVEIGHVGTNPHENCNRPWHWHREQQIKSLRLPCIYSQGHEGRSWKFSVKEKKNMVSCSIGSHLLFYSWRSVAPRQPQR